MSIADDNKRFTFVIDKNLEKKLTMLGNRENRKLGNYISFLLEEFMFNYEQNIIDDFGASEFDRAFAVIFGEEVEPQLKTLKYLDSRPKKTRKAIKPNSDK